MITRLDRGTVLFAVGLTVAVGVLLEAASLPDGSEYRGTWPDTTAYMRLRAEQAGEAGRRLDLRYRPVNLGRIPDRLRRAVRVAEDAAFYQHSGIDFHELRAALVEAWRRKQAPRGASTITQQLARNLYLSPERSLVRKAREAVIALKMESELGKVRILELYLNVIELGDGVFGAQAASIHYFGLRADMLSRRQAAMLAATIPSPRSDNPSTGTREFRWRSRLVFRRAFGERSDSVARDTLRPPPGVPGRLPVPESIAEPTPDPVSPGRTSGAGR